MAWSGVVPREGDQAWERVGLAAKWKHGDRIGE